MQGPILFDINLTKFVERTNQSLIYEQYEIK